MKKNDNNFLNELESIIKDLLNGNKPNSDLDPKIIEAIKKAMGKIDKFPTDKKLKQQLLEKIEAKIKSEERDSKNKEASFSWLFLKRGFLALASFVIIAGGLFGIYKLLNPDEQLTIFTEVYALTSDQVSQGANIVINLPKYVTKESAYNNIKFNPEIKGQWLETTEEGKIIFKPEKNLDLEMYYAATLDTENGQISSDFKIVEPPKIVNVFPASDSETSEYSEITIIFSRPMVPLTTLDMLDQFEIPVELIPATEGKWKWIGTRTLQFEPKERLKRSTNYAVKIKSEFISEDGLKVDGTEHKFTTRPIRYNYVSSDTTIYSSPIRINFNQPVNLEKTKNEIVLKNTTTDKEVEFIAEYGKKKEGENEIIDESTILVYQKTDTHGRAKLWDFTNNYSIEIKKAYPAEGDIFIDFLNSSNISVTDIVKNFYTTSERSYYSDENLFDEEGKTWIEFYEEVDLQKLTIKGDKITKIEYGEKCKEEETDVWYAEEAECEKETDKSKIYLEFDSSNVDYSEKLNINLEKIINIQNQQINFKPIEYTLTARPKLDVRHIFPDKESASDLNNMTICSNAPLFQPEAENIDEYLKVSGGYKFIDWQESYKISSNTSEYEKCEIDEFHTDVNYLLAPLENYQVTLNIGDVFGEKVEKSISFKTGEIQDYYLNFYHYQGNYSVTTADKTKMTFAVENMDYVDMEICELKALDMLEILENQPFYTQENISKACNWSTQKRLDLPKKYWDKNYFQVILADYIPKNNGHYMLTFSNPNYKDWDNSKIYERSYVTVTNIGVVKKELQVMEYEYIEDDIMLTQEQKDKLKNIYWINDLKTAKPISNANIELYQRKEIYENGYGRTIFEKTGNVSTNSDGIVESPIVTNSAGAIILKDGQSAIISSSYGTQSNLDYVSSSFNDKRIFIYTDRPIYRPGDRVQLKGFYRIGYDGNYEMINDKKIQLFVRNSLYEETVKQELEINDFGTFNTSFVLDSTAPLGRYEINVENGWYSFDVEEYVPAPFKLEAQTNKEEYMSGDNLEVDISADYYFGVPLEGGKMQYSISSQDYYFDKYTDEYFNFGSDWYYCWYDCDYGDKFILRGTAEIDANGKAKIKHELDFDKFFKSEEERKSKIMVVHITAQNLNGQSVSTQKSFIVHNGKYYLGLKSDRSFVAKNEAFEVKVKSVDTEGKALSIKDAEIKIDKIKWIQSRRKEVDGGYYYKWEKELTEIQNEKIETDRNGNYSGSFKIDTNGEFELRVISKDDLGNKITSKINVYVYESGASGSFDSDVVRPYNDTTLELETEKDSLKPGEKASILIKNPFKEARALIAIERGKIFEYAILDINQNFYKYEFDIKDEYMPNIFATVTLISNEPSVKYGKINFQIDSGEKNLNIEIKSDKEKYLPGEKVSLEFDVKDGNGNAVETELSVAVVDLSVLALKGNPKKNPLIFFYNNLPLAVETSSNLKNILQEIEIKKGKGGGGGDGTDATKKRGEFKDTAYWQAIINTDANGKASLNFILPDNLTTWQVESVGISKDTKVGAGYIEFMTRKELMLTPIKPRFVVPGDELMIGAKIFNQSEETQNLGVTFASETLILDENVTRKTIKLDKGETRLVYFRVKVPQEKQTGLHTFVLSAHNEKFEDTVENTIKITRNDTYETVATANYSNEKIENEYIYVPENVVPDKGKIEINSSATLAVFISDGLNSLLSFPYGCAEQISSKLHSIAIVKKGLNLENIGDKFEIDEIEFDGQKYTLDESVERGLAKIYESQNTDGGFGYYSNWNWESNFYVSVSIAQTLINLKNAGYEINEESLTKVLNFIENWLKNKSDRQTRDNLIIATDVIFQTERNSDFLISSIKEKVLNDEKFIKEDINNIALAKLAMIMTQKKDSFKQTKDGQTGFSKDEVYEVLENRIKIDARGAHLPMSVSGWWWQYYETPEKNTALLLKALITDNRDNKIIDRVLRWLLASRDKDGAWSTTNNTLNVIDAMTDFMVWQQENESNFKLNITIDGQEKASYDFNPDTILNQEQLVIEPINKLPLGKLMNLQFAKENNNDKPNNFYYDIMLKYFLPINAIPPRDEGFTITRDFYALSDTQFKNPLDTAKVGDVLKGRMQIIVPEYRNLVSVEDYIPAGVELINFNLATEDSANLEYEEEINEVSGEANRRSSTGAELYDRTFYPQFEELRDDRLFMFTENVAPGIYTYEYYVRVLVPGKFHHLPAVVSEMYFPENFARTKGDYFEITE